MAQMSTSDEKTAGAVRKISLRRYYSSEETASEELLATVNQEGDNAPSKTSQVALKGSTSDLRSFTTAFSHVPEPLADTVVEFTMNLLLEQPTDPFEYGKTYFRKLIENKHTPIEYDELLAPVLEEAEERTISVSCRRKSIFTKSFDPDSQDFIKPYYPKSYEQYQMLLEVSKNIFLFRSLDEDRLSDVLNALFRRKVTKGAVIITQGDEGDYLYVIEKGIFNVYKSFDDGEPIHVHTYNNQGFFGELALMYNQPRAATVRAETDGIIWALDRNTFRQLVLHAAFEERRMYEELVDNAHLFDGLAHDEKMKIADALVPRKFKDGEFIAKRGDADQGVYFVVSGKVSMRINDDKGEEIEIGKVTSGEFFGETALLRKTSFEENIVAEGDTRLAFLDVDTFENVLGSCTKKLGKHVRRYTEDISKETGNLPSFMACRTQSKMTSSPNVFIN